MITQHIKSTLLETTIILIVVWSTANAHIDQYRFGRPKINESFPDEQRLIHELLSSYDTAARPVFNASKSVLITMALSLVQISDMDERNQIFTSIVWIEQEWLDERLEWNSSKYNNLDKLRIPCSRLWLPDVVLYNSADDYNKGFMQSKAMVKPSGYVFWPLPIKLRSSCKIDVTYFPFDDQVCRWKFGSWTYSGLQVDLNSAKNQGDLSNYVESGEWELKSVTAIRHVEYYPCCPDEPYPDITFTVVIRRRVLYFLFNIILPCVWLSILSLIGFWLPPDSGEKITLGITVLLAFSVFMLLIAENIPATSETVPLIVIYLTSSMSLTSLSIILTVFLSQLHHAGTYAPLMSRCFYKFMTRKAAFLVGMTSTVKRYEQRIIHQKVYKKDPHTNNVQFINSFKDRSKAKLLYNGYASSNQFKDSAQNHHGLLKSQTDDFLTDKEIKVRKYRPHEIKRRNDSVSYDMKRSLPVLNYETDTFNFKHDELLKNMKKINATVKLLLNKDKEEKNSAIVNEWKLIGIIMDRLLFWMFFSITFSSSSILLIILPILKHTDTI